MGAAIVIGAVVFGWVISTSLRTAAGATVPAVLPGAAASELAQQTISAASQAVESTGLVLGFIQAFGVLLGLVGAGSVAYAWEAVRRFNERSVELRAEYESERAKLEERFQELRMHSQIDFEKLFEQEKNLLTQAEEADDQLQEVQRLLQEARPQIAEIQIVHATAPRLAQKQQATALLQLAQQQISAKNHPAALKTLEHARQFDDENQVIQYLLGELYLMEISKPGRLDEAIDALEKAVNVGSSNDRFEFPNAEAALGYAYRLRGERFKENTSEHAEHFARSKQRLGDVLSRYPTLLSLVGESWYGAYGNLHRQLGQLDKAIEYYDQARQITPNNSYPYNNLGLLYRRINKLEESRECFENARIIAHRQVEGRPFDFFARFDEMTASVALEMDIGAVQPLFEELNRRRPSPEEMEKFLAGLNLLNDANAPRNLSHYIEWARQIEAAARKDSHHAR